MQNADANTLTWLLTRPAGLGIVMLVAQATAVSTPPVARRDSVLPSDVAVGGAFSLIADALRLEADVPPFANPRLLALMSAGSALAYWAATYLVRVMCHAFPACAAYA